MKTWARGETETLIKNYNLISNAELQKLIPNKTPQGIYKKAYKMGLRKSKVIEFLNRSESRKGEKSSNWNGGRKTNKSGYVLIHCPDNHRADSSGYAMEHILVWESATGIQVPRNCCIHHLNGKKDDNRIENLCLMDFAAHTVFHSTGRKYSEESRKKISESRKKYYAEHSLLNRKNGSEPRT